MQGEQAEPSPVGLTLGHQRPTDTQVQLTPLSKWQSLVGHPTHEVVTEAQVALIGDDEVDEVMPRRRRPGNIAEGAPKQLGRETVAEHRGVTQQRAVRWGQAIDALLQRGLRVLRVSHRAIRPRAGHAPARAGTVDFRGPGHRAPGARPGRSGRRRSPRAPRCSARRPSSGTSSRMRDSKPSRALSPCERSRVVRHTNHGRRSMPCMPRASN